MKRRMMTMLMCLLLILTGCGNAQETDEVTEDVPDEQTEEIEVDAFDQLDALYLWGADPGLGISVLHELGYTGEGVNVAYIDQPINDEPDDEIADSVVKNTNIADKDDQMHGQAVSSLLCGKHLGTAPGVNLYYYGYPSWKEDQQQYWITCLEKLMEDNKKLPEGEKIRMAGFSNNPVSDAKYYSELMDTIKKCNDEGIMVWFCGEYLNGIFDLYSDRNDKENLTPIITDAGDDYLVLIPSGSRTSMTSNSTYQYDIDGGLSWTMPYALGVYCIAQSIDNTLTQDEIRQLVKDTAYVNHTGYRVFDPVEFIAHVLEKNGRDDDAKELRKAYLDSLEYIYVLYNGDIINEKDLEAIERYAGQMLGREYVLFDCKDLFQDAQKIYMALQEHHKEHGGRIAGIQIFGDLFWLAPFKITYKALTPANQIDEASIYVTDYFYQNLDNDISPVTKGYSVYKHFDEGIDLDLTPHYPVARIPLNEGEISEFLDKYMDFAEQTGLEKMTLVNFSNPIFKEREHSDDMGFFLNRMKDEYGLIDGNYELYGNLKGDYPVRTEVLGDFSRENIAMVNDQKPAEFLINTHGQKANIDMCYFENEQEIRESLFDTSNINSIMDGNYYYLDLWTCNNGQNMSENLTIRALQGKAMGVFSATHIISNTDVNNNVSVGMMKKCNFYYFYFTYLRSLNKGFSRAASFYKAQYKYLNAVMEEAEKGNEGTGSYQFALNNLFVYNNFGLLDRYDINTMNLDDRDDIYDSERFIREMEAAGNSRNEFYDDYSLEYVGFQGGEIKILDYTIKKTTTGDYLFTVVMEAPEGYGVGFFDPPGGDLVNVQRKATAEGENTYRVCVSPEAFSQLELLAMQVGKSDDDRCFVFLKLKDIDDSEIVEYEEPEPVEGGGGYVPAENEEGYSIDQNSYKGGEIKVTDYSKEKTASGSYIFTITADIEEGYAAYFFNPPGGDIIMTPDVTTVKGENTFSVEISAEDYEKIQMMVLYIGKSDNDRAFISMYK